MSKRYAVAYRGYTDEKRTGKDIQHPISHSGNEIKTRMRYHYTVLECFKKLLTSAN